IPLWQPQRNLEGYVGFANLPNQVYRKSVKRGFEFTLMVVGESGLGKSTLINSLFLTDLYSKDYPGPSQRIKKTVQNQKQLGQRRMEELRGKLPQGSVVSFYGYDKLKRRRQAAVGRKDRERRKRSNLLKGTS
uniref:Septin-type G domain-containing protein n=1 Tax=Poecilia latipinna TaxID=48699 RepID=A0A3B3VEQ2_9TELE